MRLGPGMGTENHLAFVLEHHWAGSHKVWNSQ